MSDNAEDALSDERAARGGQSEDRLQRLLAIVSALSRAPGRQQVAAVILRHGQEALGAEAGVLAKLEGLGTSLEVIRAFGNVSIGEGKSLPVRYQLPICAAVRRRAPVVLATGDQVRENFPLFDEVAQVREGGLVAAPLIVDGRVIGAFQLCFAEGRHPDGLDSEFLMTIAELAAQALERARLLDEACRAEERMRALAEVLPQHVFIEGPDGRFEYLNQRAIDFMGVDRDQLVGLATRTLRERITHPDDLAAAAASSAESRRAVEPIEVTLRMRRVDGVYRRFLIRVQPLREADGIRWIGISTDVEALAQAERALAERDAQLRYLAESSIIGLGTFDLAGTVTELNATAREMLGVTAEEVAQGSVVWQPWAAPEFRERADAAVAAVARQGFFEPFETELVRRDGTRVAGLVGAMLIPGTTQAVAFMVDTSERKRIEREHAALVELEQSFRDRLMGIVGHDLRTPLAAINGWLTLLRESPVHSSVDHTAIDRIGRSAARMRRMIDQLLDFTRARQAGGIPIERGAADLSLICRAVVEELASTHPGRVHFHAEDGLAGEWDSDRLAQVVSNLANNALQHGGDGPITIRATGDAAAVRLEVHNSGRPIAPAVLARIFDPYRRGSGAGGGRAGSLGLGLYIVQQIVQAHGGTIDVSSTAGDGTSFTVRLPR
jgi:PAS domain S-box-containing protein